MRRRDGSTALDYLFRPQLHLQPGGVEVAPREVLQAPYLQG
jgi:hypothetical protein